MFINSSPSTSTPPRNKWPFTRIQFSLNAPYSRCLLLRAASQPAVRLPGCLRFPDLALEMISAWQKLFPGQFGKQDSICEENSKWHLRMAGWRQAAERAGAVGCSLHPGCPFLPPSGPPEPVEVGCGEGTEAEKAVFNLALLSPSLGLVFLGAPVS